MAETRVSQAQGSDVTDRCVECGHPLAGHLNLKDCLEETDVGEACKCERAMELNTIISRALEGWDTTPHDLRTRQGKRRALADLLEAAIRECSSIADCLTGATSVGRSILKAAGLGPTASDTHPAAAECAKDAHKCPQTDANGVGGCQIPPTS
jgi:hypothetical protein